MRDATTSRTVGTGSAALRRGAAAVLFAALAFTASAARGGDNASFVSYSGVSLTMKPGGKKSVTVTMRNIGTTTWRATVSGGTVTSYALIALGNGWGVDSVGVSGVAPNQQREFTMEITAPKQEGDYVFQWQMTRRTDKVNIPIGPIVEALTSTPFGDKTTSVTIKVTNKEPDTAPTFGDQTISDQVWERGKAITAVDLPSATGGNGALKYSLVSCYLPNGVSRKKMQIVGTPATAWGPTNCTWKVEDSDDNKADSDADTLTFQIWAKRPALTASPKNLTIKSGATGTFTVAPTTPPTGKVTVSVSSGAAGTATVSPATLIFNKGETAAKTVTVTGVLHCNATNKTTTINLRASGGGYNNVSASVSVTVTAGDTPAPVASLPKLTVNEGGNGSFGVKLAARPAGTVSVTLESDDTGAATVSSSLQFSTSNWNTTKSVKVSGVRDPDAWDENVTIDLESSEESCGKGTASVAATVNDVDSRGIDVDPTSLSIVEGETGVFKANLATLPSEPVTVSVTSTSTTVATVGPSSLAFNAFNYSSTKEVTVTGKKAGSVTINLKASGGDYGNESASVSVTVEKDTAPSFGNEDVGDKVWTKDVAITPITLPDATGGNGPLSHAFNCNLPTGVTRSNRTISGTPTALLDATTCTWKATDSDNNRSDSDAAILTFTVSVVAATPPPSFGKTISNMTLIRNRAMTSKALPAATGGTGTFTYALSPTPPAGLSFDASSSSRTLSGTPTAAQDATEYTYTATDSATPSPNTASLTFTIAIVDLTVSTTSLTVTEGTAAEDKRDFTVKLAALPTADVTVSVSSGDTTVATVSSASLTFTTTNYNTFQTVTVTGVEDADASNESTTVNLSASGGGYDNVSASVSVTVTDDDTRTVVVSPASSTVTEGGSGTFTAKLATQPTADVTVSVSSGDPGAATASPATLTFTTTNYTTAQTVTVTGKQDADASDESVTVGLTAAGGDYANVSASVAVTVDDDETAALTVSPTSLTVAEGGSGTFTAKLATQPTANVTVSVSSGDPGAATASPASLTFTTTNYATAQTVTVTGKQDADAADESVTVGLTAAGGDYANVSASVGATVTDDDTKAVVASPTSLTVAEGGSGTFTAKLATQPTANVTVTVSSGDTTAATASPSSLTFTTTNYNTTQTVTVTGEQDADAANESTTVDLTAAGGDYASVRASVAVTVTDDDSADKQPSFGGKTIPDMTLTQNRAMTSTVLPAATGGDGTLAYSLSPALPAGLSFDSSPSSRTLSGTPTATLAATTYTYTATDTDGDTATLTFAIAVSAAPAIPTFSETIRDRTWVKNVSIGTVTLPKAIGGTGSLSYSLTGTLPAGVTFDASARTLSGTPTKKQSAVTYTYKATDTAAKSATLTFTIRVDGKASDGAAFVSYTGVPSTMTAGSTATVTVRMRNAGTTTWTSAAAYQLGSQRPADNTTWGLKRVALPASTPPNATADFSFSITAPAKTGSYKFRWRMLKGAAGWFGAKSTLETIAVSAAPDTSPSFGTPPLDRTWVKNVSIGTVTLPAATGGNGKLAYSLTGTLPAGVTFDATARTLSGTPTKKQAATTYTYKATDTDGDAATVTFTIRVDGKASDGASFVSYTGLPSTMAAGSTATVTVRMRNAGTTTWTSAAGYQLGSQRPEDNTTWGLKRVALPASTPPNATADFTFTITAPAKTGSYKFRWRMLKGAAGWFGAKSTLETIAVEADTTPSFGSSSILDKTWVKNVSIGTVTLPAATGGNGKLSYSLTGTLPAGVTFDDSTRRLSGTPTSKQDATTYTYKATDADGDAATLTFTIRVAGKASDGATFVSYTGVPTKIVAGGKATVTVRMQNTGTTTWTSANYKLGSQRPENNTTWGLKRVSLASDVAPNATGDFTFTIVAPTTTGSYKFRWQMIQGSSGWFGAKTTLNTITVEDPSFGDATVADQAWIKGTPIASLTLPAASGGTGALTYALTPSPPAGVTFTAATRTLAGTPTAAKAEAWYTYTATDTDGDKATISFRIEATEAPVDNAAFVSYSGVPSKIAAGGTATVTVTMRNTGTTTWTSAAGYKLGAQSPADNTTWVSSRVSVPSDTAPNATADFTFAIAAPSTTGSHAFAWQMVRDAATWFGDSTTSKTITVEDPSFGDATVADQAWVKDTAIATLTLPAASGSNATLTYALSPALPAGVTFAAATRTLSGTPTASQTGATYTYTATDGAGNKATLTFRIRVAAAAGDSAAFVSATGVPTKMAAGGTATVTVTMRNTGTTTWTTALGYKLGSQSPADNTTWGTNRVSLASDVAPNGEAVFTISITAPSTTGGHVFAWRMVRDPGSWFGDSTTSATIAVEDPSFGAATVANQSWTKDAAIASLTLPAASGGGGRVTYSLTPELPAGVTFAAATRTVSGTPTATLEATTYTYTATGRNGGKTTLTFSATVTEGASAWSSTALAPPSPSGAVDMFEYWLLPHGSALKVRTRLGDGRAAPAEGTAYLRSFWRGDLWGRKVALLGDPGGERYDIFEEVEGGLDYWGTFGGASAGGEARPSVALDRPFRWMNRFMAVGDVVEGPATGRLLSDRRRNQDGVLWATMRMEALSHRAAFEVPPVPGLVFEDVLEVRYWPDAARAEVHDTFFLARGYGAVYARRSGVASVVEWWAVEKALTPVAPAAPAVPWFDPFSPGWPKTAVLNGNLDDVAPGAGLEGERAGTSGAPRLDGGQDRAPAAPGWTAAWGDAAVARPPSGLDAGAWSLVLRGGGDGGDGGDATPGAAPDAAVTEDWIPIEGGTYQLSACMVRENARDNVFVDFDDGAGRDADFDDAHLVASSTGAWECRAMTKCIPASVGAIRIRAARDGANLGDAWFDRLELKRIAACEERPRRPTSDTRGRAVDGPPR